MNTQYDKIIIYPGRFQPFGPHHFKTYQWLCSNFGKDKVYVVSSNTTDNGKNPLTFDEKVPFMRKYGVPQSNIYQVANQYKATELLSEFDPKRTVSIFVYGEKDAGRIKFELEDGSPAYFQPYYGQKNLNPLYVNGYALEAPHVKLNTDGSEINGTLLRKKLATCTEDEFEELMGWYDDGIHDLCRSKIGGGSMSESILIEGSITKTQLLRIEQYADRLFKEYGIDIEFQDLYRGTHFFQRLNDPRNGKDITTDELRAIFKKVSQQYGSRIAKMSPGAEAVMHDMESDINLPFIIKYDKVNREIDLFPKTIMRKKGFKSHTPMLSVEGFGLEESNKPELYGRHIMHPFEDTTLTFKELASMVRALCEEPMTLNPKLKVDGQNLQVTVVGGNVYAARNKTTAMKPMTKVQLTTKFATPSFALGFDVLETALKGSTSFKEGKLYLNCELCFPDSTNVYQYEPTIYVHGTVEYDNLGNIVSKSEKVPMKLPLKVGECSVIPTPTFEMNAIPKLYPYFYNNLRKILENSRLSVENRISELPDKNVEILRKLIFITGNRMIMHNAPNSENVAERILGQMQQVKAQVEQLVDTKMHDKYRAYMERFNSVGGEDSIQPIEGFIFTWNGKQYKMTGSFNPINGMLGILKYNKDKNGE